MANRYWIASTQQNWNSTSNWSTTSGGASGASVPGVNDDVFFNSSGLGRCVVNTAATWKSITKSAGDLYLNYNITLTIKNNFSHTGGDFTIQNRSNFQFNENGFLVVEGNLVQSTAGTFQCNDGIINVYGDMTTGTGFLCTTATIALYGQSKTYTCNTADNPNKLYRLIIEGVITCNSNLEFVSNNLPQLIINGGFTYSLDTLSVENFQIFGTLNMTYVGTKFLIVKGNLSHFFGEIIGETSLILQGDDAILSPNDYSQFNFVSFQNDTGIESYQALVEGGVYTFSYMGLLCDGANFSFDFNGATVNLKTLSNSSGSYILSVFTNGAKINITKNPDIGLGYMSLTDGIFWNSDEDTIITAIDTSAFVLASDNNDYNVYDKIVALKGLIVRANPDDEGTTAFPLNCLELDITGFLGFIACEVNITNDLILDGYIELSYTPSITVGGDLSIIGSESEISYFTDVNFNVSGEALIEYGIAINSDASAGSVIQTRFVYDGLGNENWDFANKRTIINPSNFTSSYRYNISNKGVALQEVAAQIGLELISYPANTSLKFYGKSSAENSYSLLKHIHSIDRDGKFIYNWECREQGKSYQWYAEISNAVGIENTLVQQFTVPYATKQGSTLIVDCKNINQSVSTNKLLVRPNFGKAGSGAYISANLLSRMAKNR